ncbi:MAG: hypothetical protein GX640_15520 [Fibrobacter sp.]|nr:hypothetical protein [Fibrobacter sp.]
MNRALCFAVGLLVPVAVSAEVNIDVHISNNPQSSKASDNIKRADYDFIDDGDPFFEDAPSQGPLRISFEYQWSLLGSSYILRYREVRFNPWADNWVFGPWLIKENVCHHSCKQRHDHVFYHPKKTSVNWRRQIRKQNGRTVCYYEFVQPASYRRGSSKIYRHEYQPLSKHNERHDRYEPYNNSFRNNHAVKSVEKVEVRPDGVYKTKTVKVKEPHDNHNVKENNHRK